LPTIHQMSFHDFPEGRLPGQEVRTFTSMRYGSLRSRLFGLTAFANVNRWSWET
jgi:hypothetical protein